MNTVLVTGATGFLGRQLTMRLAVDGNRVHALYRSEEKIRGWEHENISFFKAALSDTDSINRAMKDCRQVYHLAAFASVWAKDSRVFYDQNVQGTVNVLESARREGVKKLVFTSTAGVFGPSGPEPNTEDKPLPLEHFTHYDRSKAIAEQKVLEYVSGGLDAVIVNPTRIFGPGILSKSNSLTLMIERYLRGRWRLIPGNGSSIGNYVYIDDVVECHLLAMEKGRVGERYLAGGDNLSFNEFFKILAGKSGLKHNLFKLPVGLMLIIAGAFQGMAWMTGRTPLITPAFVRRYNHNWVVSCDKAKKELGYSPASFEEGLNMTIEWIKK